MAYFHRKQKISRRSFLKGMMAGSAVALGLPPLEALLGDTPEIPKRFLTWFFGNGIIPDRFEPTGTGAGYTLSDQLAPLAGVKDYLSVVSGLTNHCETLITHHEGMTAFNGYSMIQDGFLSSRAGGPSIDQVIADHIGGESLIHSLQIGISKTLSQVDGGTTLHALSHRSSAEPLYPEFNPQLVWRTLFGGMLPGTWTKKLRLSVIDSVRDDLSALKNKLGAADRQRLDAHIEGVASLERKIQKIGEGDPPLDEPEETNEMTPEGEPISNVVTAMNELLVYALKTDMTRVASYLFIGGAGETYFSELGYGDSHHNYSHTEAGDDFERYHQGIVYTMEKLALLCEAMRDVEEADGSNLLDNTVLYASSDCSSGWDHSIVRMPLLVVGHGQGALKYPGEHFEVVPPPGDADNISDLLLTLRQVYDPAAGEVGGGVCRSTTPFNPIKA